MSRNIRRRVNPSVSHFIRCSVRIAKELLGRVIAYHFDLRLQIDGGTFSWAVPKGFMDLKPGAWHYAVQTPV